MNNKLYKKLLWGTGFVIVAVILTLFIMSQTYIQNLVYHERLNQMEEVTHQMFRSLEDVIDTHWDDVNVQCNYLYYTPLKTDTEFYRYLQKLSELSNYHERQIELIAVDSDGHYYTENGGMGLLREMNYLADSPQWVSYVSNSLTVDDSRMVFLEKLSTPITLQSGEKEITLCYFGISQSMTQLNDYFRCDAYENNNSVYVLDNDGFKLFNANDTELLKGHNVYTVLSRMSYLHGSSFAEAKERLDRTGSCYSNAVLDGIFLRPEADGKRSVDTGIPCPGEICGREYPKAGQHRHGHHHRHCDGVLGHNSFCRLVSPAAKAAAGAAGRKRSEPPSGAIQHPSDAGKR